MFSVTMSQDLSYDKRGIPGNCIPVLNYVNIYEPYVRTPKRVDNSRNMTNSEKKADHQWVIECWARVRNDEREWHVLRRWEYANSLQKCIRWAVADRVIMNNPEDYRIHNRVTNEAIPMAMFTELQYMDIHGFAVKS